MTNLLKIPTAVRHFPFLILSSPCAYVNNVEGLKAFATELQDLLQAKVGTTKFTTVYSRIRQSVLNTRRERRAAKAVEVSTKFLMLDYLLIIMNKY